MKRIVLTIIGIVLMSFITACEGGADHDAQVVATKQAQIEQCSASGKYPMLDPNYALAVYCSSTPIQIVPKH
jgi:hypothetical protein